RTPDILGELGSRRAGAARPVLIGFAAETNDMLAHAAAKLTGKQVDLIVANDVSRADAGFEVDTNQATFVTEAGHLTYPLESKDALARRLVDWLAERLDG